MRGKIIFLWIINRACKDLIQVSPTTTIDFLVEMDLFVFLAIIYVEIDDARKMTVSSDNHFAFS